MERETVYYDRLVDAGAQMIHVVDLNGAVAGRPVHLAELAAICAESGAPVEAGGGTGECKRYFRERGVPVRAPRE